MRADALIIMFSLHSLCAKKKGKLPKNESISRNKPIVESWKPRIIFFDVKMFTPLFCDSASSVLNASCFLPIAGKPEMRFWPIIYNFNPFLNVVWGDISSQNGPFHVPHLPPVDSLDSWWPYPLSILPPCYIKGEIWGEMYTSTGK
jgi:hypothetical protein